MKEQELKQAQAKAQPVKAAPVARPEPMYDAAEIAANSVRLFGYNVDIARAALEYNSISRCSIATAKKIIKDFAERKV